MIVRNFEYLLALHREGHFSKAAKSCHVSQPTLSAGIKQLEEDMDLRIVRHGKRYDGLTREGMRVLAWAQQMYDDCKGLEREVSALRKGVAGPFRLGILNGTSAVAPILSVALAEKMPLLEQSIVTDDTSSLLKALRDHKLDVALLYFENIGQDNFDTHLLYRERIFLFQSESNRQPRTITWDDVVNRPLCLLKSAVPKIAQTQLAQCTARVIHTDSMDVLVAHVASGKYSAVLPQSMAEHLMQIPHLQALAITGPGSQVNVGFVAARHGLESAPLRSLLEMIHTPELVNPIQAVLGAHRKFRPKADQSAEGSNEQLSS